MSEQGSWRRCVQVAVLVGFWLPFAKLPGDVRAEDDASRLNLIPWPARCERGEGFFHISPSTRIICSGELPDIAQLAAEQLGCGPVVADGQWADDTICLTCDASLATEAYRLKITPTRITIAGGSPTGVLCGAQTLRQVVGPDPLSDSVRIPCLGIEDQPRFAWRGLLLDCSRTFQSLAYLRKTIDRMVFYKLNVLQLHLTDDQGWRLEIRQYPRLTEKGARFSSKYNEPPEHEGFYSQAEMKALIQYAQRRGVTIVPEIEMPGHASAALVCYPELSCTGEMPDDIFPYFKGPYVTENIFCAGNDEVFTFLNGVLDEVVEIFPSEFIHIGGDEALKPRWKACPKCQARIKALGLRDEEELQDYFVGQIERHLASKGRRLMGWDAIFQEGLAPRAAVMSYRGMELGLAAARAGHTVVMSPNSHCYFDYPYSQINSERTYALDPVIGLTPGEARNVLGVHASFWSHIDREPALVDRQLFPRLVALAERGWSPASVTDWAAMERRLTEHLKWFSRFQIAYQVEAWAQ